MTKAHPYVEFEGTPLWQALTEVFRELEENRDVAVTTASEYVIGYACLELARKNLVAPEALAKAGSHSQPRRQR
jgi:hypothetical protein